MFTLNCKGRLLKADEPMVMGIINITPDSFYAGSRHADMDAILQTAGSMLEDGAAILDIGGQSTRPQSKLITADEEIGRVTAAIAAIHARYPNAVISIDTFYAKVAQAAVVAGASMVNDISGGTFDAGMLATVAQLKVPYICTHIKGTPQTMHTQSKYDNLPLELLDYFAKRIEACQKAGIHDVIIDPGFGFAKDAKQNFRLLSALNLLCITGKAILVGLSRKRTIYHTLGVTAAEALNGTTVMHTLALEQGAAILRAHDVKAAREAIMLFMAYRRSVTEGHWS